MGFEVYDYREDVRNVLVTPQLRSRFMRMEAGEVAAPHSHDLGHEVFLVLEGSAEFEIDGDKRVLGPGQMCIALVDQLHGIRVVGDGPMTMYLSVTPHIQPTHTMWRGGDRMPHRFVPASAYDQETDTTPFEDAVKRLVDNAEAVSKAAHEAHRVQAQLAPELRGTVDGNDLDAASALRDEMWDALSPLFRQCAELADAWNSIAPRAGKT